jgi:hypothetical protein
MVYFQIVLTMQSYFVRPAGMADMLCTSLSGSTVRLGQSRVGPAPLQTAIIDALMSSELPGAYTKMTYSTVHSLLPCVIGIPVFHKDCWNNAYINHNQV